MSTSNFELNGLMDSVLPNIYINRITLEKLNSRPLSNNKYDMTPHINQTLLPKIKQKVDLGFDPENPDWEMMTVTAPSFTADYGGFKNVLKVTLDMFLEIPNIDDNSFWDMIFTEDMINYLSIRTRFYSGKAKEYYMQETTGYTTDPEDATKIIDTPLNEVIKAISSIYNNLEQASSTAKEQYKESLPDGTSVFKIPIQVTTQLGAETAFPTDLAVLAQCTLDLSQAENLPVSLQSPMSGRTASEVIIKNKKIQDKGMMFFISSKQDDGTFDHLKGQIWLGEVHKHNDRYMVGSAHSDSPHPYLDYVIVPNNRIQDFRQISVLQKQSINFTPTTNLIFGGSYTDLQSTRNSAVKSLDNTAIFSDLISTTTQDGKVKLFFSVDWGRLIKKHCAVPALIDKLALSDGAKLAEFFVSTANGGKGSPAGALSFRIFREEIGMPVNVINDNRELIYDGFPKIFYKKNDKKDGVPTSSLIPIPLYVESSYNGFIKSYSFTDYRKGPDSTAMFKPNHDSGKFKYSIEIVVHDPTIPYLTKQLLIAQQGVSTLKKLVTLTSGQGSETYWNKYLGKFNNTLNAEWLKIPVEGTVPKAIEVFKFMTSMMRSNYTSSAAEISTADSEEPTNLDLMAALQPMIDPDTASPSSIAAVYEIFTTLTSQLKSFIESFSVAKLPKASEGTDANGSPILKQFAKMPVGASLPQRKIKVKHTFDKLSEIVDTTNMDAGHDIFATWAGHSEMDIGLKLMHADDYVNASQTEHERFFGDEFPDAITVFFNIRKQGIPTPTSLISSVGRFFTVPEDVEKTETPHTKLPETIMSVDDGEFSYWKLANNIIRYKFGLFGNPDEKSFLGYENMHAAEKAGDTGAINDKMERVLKSYQSLSHQGAIFSHRTPVLPKYNLPEAGSKADTETEGSPKVSTNALPWAKNIGQERFLLSLIMQDYFDLSFDDKKLGTFNTGNKLAPICKQFAALADMFPVDTPWEKIRDAIKKGVGASRPGAPGEIVVPGLDDLPNQIKTLIFNNFDATGQNMQNKLNVNVSYADDNKFNTLYKTQTMFASKFGEYWFKHQNLFEVEYLSSFGSSVAIPPTAGKKAPQRYEDLNRSSVKALNWQPLTLTRAAALGGVGGKKVLLCRLKRYKNPVFNQKAYDVLGLPLYDEYFFLSFKAPKYFDAVSLKQTMANLGKEYIKLD